MDTHVYKRVDGIELLADVYPALRDEGRTPVLLLLHAGSLIAGGRAWFPAYQIDAYRRFGHTVVAIDYRLAPETKGPDIISDVIDAVRWIRDALPENSPVDPSRLGIIGHSAGGYLALHMGHVLEQRPRAIVSFYGYGDLLGKWYVEPDPHYAALAPITRDRAAHFVGARPIADGSLAPQRLDFYVHCRQQGSWLAEVFGHEDADLDALVPYCPDRHVDEAYPPTLLLHGDADTDVPYEKSQRMAEALSRRGVEHELVTVTGAGHTFDLPPRYQFRTGPRATLMRRVIGWLSPVLPRMTLRGAGPPGSDRYMERVIAFLDDHLRET